MKKALKISLYSISTLAFLYLVLLIPTTSGGDIKPANQKAFHWADKSPSQQYRQFYQKFKGYDQQQLDSTIALYDLVIYEQLLFIKKNILLASHPVWDELITTYSAYAALNTLSPKQKKKLTIFHNEIRKSVKAQSILWDSDALLTKNTLYKTNYATRAVYEEALYNTKRYRYLTHIQDEPTQTPSFQLQGITIHSGDILLSRGGAEVSALISRSNDYPGNFSHAALAYVDEKGTPYIFESHIEVGVTKSTVEEYLSDEKLRIMVLRPKSKLLELTKNPMIPHQAAERINKEKTSRHIPYDFAMDLNEKEKLFCSEVVSFAYKEKGINLWSIPSTISEKGTANWLNTFGVEHFITQMPSDLEYDPQLSIIAEWRDSSLLSKDRLYSAAMDILLKSANHGDQIQYNQWVLPFARALKGFCYILNLFHIHWIIPEGMTATQALKSETFIQKHEKERKKIQDKLNLFYQSHQGIVTYNDLLSMDEKKK